MDLSPEEAIKEYLLPMSTPPMTDLESSSFVLIRHALSTFNYKHLVYMTKYGKDAPETKATEIDPSIMDAELHPVGVLQCEAHHPVTNSIEWKTVFVSPFRRAIQTAIHLFKNHPNKGNIKFVILPIVREVIQDYDDIVVDYDTGIMQRYKTGSPENHGLVFDFSRFYLYGIP